MNDQVAFVTKQIMSEHKVKSAAAFARGLGLNLSSMAVIHWLNGTKVPSRKTLYAVLLNPNADRWAYLWAAEILKLSLNDPADICQAIAETPEG